MLLDLMIPFHLRHPLEPLLIGSVMSLGLLFTAYTLMARARRHRWAGHTLRARVQQAAAGPLIGVGAYLSTMALVTNWVSKPYADVLLAPETLPYFALGTALGTGAAFSPGRFWRIAFGALLGSLPVATVMLKMLEDGEATFSVTFVACLLWLAAQAGTMTGVALWLSTSPSHISRAGAALFSTSALTITLSAVPAVLGRSDTLWSTSTGIITPYAAWSATVMVFFLVSCAVAEHFRLARIERDRREMERSQMRLDGLVRASFEGLVVHRDGLIVDCNERFREMSQWRPFDHLPAATVGHLIEAVDEPETVDADPHDPRETVLKVRDGNRMPVEVLSQRLSQDKADTTIVTAVRDLTQRKAQDAAIAHLARHDGMTGLLNRTAFHADTEKLLRAGGRGALLLIDLDHFKPVNDTHGHPAGDHVLKVLSNRFRSQLREGDLLARLGGDEFAVLLLDPAPAEKVAERLVKVAARPVALDAEDGEPAHLSAEGGTTDVRLSASLGIALYPQDANTFDTLFANGDSALYRAKDGGRDQVRRYDPRMQAHAEERLRMAEDLKRAVREGLLDVAYQPIFAVASGETAALEALVRWDDPHHGEVQPETFLPLAEEAHIMPALGRFVMNHAFATAARTGLRVCVNVAPQQLADRDFLAHVDEALEEAGIAPAMVELEVTERALRSEDPLHLERLEALAARGFPIALDDFGSGPSALSALHRYPFGRIKLDGAFLRDLDPDTAPELLSALLRLARVQKLQVTAEGIESHAELALMTRVGLDNVQGYLLARPGDAARVRMTLEDAA